MKKLIFDKAVEKAKKENHKQYTYKVMIQSNKKIMSEFKKELVKLFDKYIPKTTNGFIEDLPTKPASF